MHTSLHSAQRWFEKAAIAGKAPRLARIKPRGARNRHGYRASETNVPG